MLFLPSCGLHRCAPRDCAIRLSRLWPPSPAAAPPQLLVWLFVKLFRRTSFYPPQICGTCLRDTGTLIPQGLKRGVARFDRSPTGALALWAPAVAALDSRREKPPRTTRSNFIACPRNKQAGCEPLEPRLVSVRPE